jgi:PPOX class probable F420-dependent enzyme
MRDVRKDLSLEELGDLLERPFNATLATYRRDGSVLLSPVWHEWRDGGFGIITGIDDVKLRHIERRPEAVAVVADNEPPFRGIEVSATPSVIRDSEVAHEAFRRIATRYLGEARARPYVDRLVEQMVLIRLSPGRVRTWDFADDYALVGQA